MSARLYSKTEGGMAPSTRYLYSNLVTGLTLRLHEHHYHEELERAYRNALFCTYGGGGHGTTASEGSPGRLCRGFMCSMGLELWWREEMEFGLGRWIERDCILRLFNGV